MPLHRKLYLVFRNNLIKIIKGRVAAVIRGSLVVERKRNDSRFGRIAVSTDGVLEVGGMVGLIVSKWHS
jgi:hypothetical protein